MIRITSKPGIQILEETNEVLLGSGNQQKRIKVEPIMSSILLKLEASKGFVTRDELIDDIWDGNFPVGNKALTKNIYKVRKTFEQHGLNNPIETIPKKGYRWVQHTHQKRSILQRSVLPVLIVLLAFVVLKITYPGFLHFIAHRLVH